MQLFLIKHHVSPICGALALVGFVVVLLRLVMQ
jgi:hypothetical protein